MRRRRLVLEELKPKLLMAVQETTTLGQQLERDREFVQHFYLLVGPLNGGGGNEMLLNAEC